VHHVRSSNNCHVHRYHWFRKREFYFHWVFIWTSLKNFWSFSLIDIIFNQLFLFILSYMLVYGFSEKKYKRCGRNRLHEHAVLFYPLFNEIILRSFFVCSTTKKQQRIANFALYRKYYRVFLWFNRKVFSFQKDWILTID
jgi:hypothetical protein